jgi:hypothetical protein
MISAFFFFFLDYLTLPAAPVFVIFTNKSLFNLFACPSTCALGFVVQEWAISVLRAHVL